METVDMNVTSEKVNILTAKGFSCFFFRSIGVTDIKMLEI